MSLGFPWGGSERWAQVFRLDPVDGGADMRVLLVEDERTLASAVVELLRSETYAVDLAATGAEADELVAVNTYDLVVLDWGSRPPPASTCCGDGAGTV